MRRNGSRLLTGIIVGIMCAITLGGGLILLIRGADSIMLRCERASDACTLTFGDRLGRTTQRFALSEVQQAVVKSRTARRGPTYSVEIQRADGKVAYISGKSPRDEREQREIADAFDRFLRNQQTPTYVFSRAAPSVLFFSLIWIAFGAGFGALSYRQFQMWRQGE